MIWYLPEVSVVLENDPALFDTMLDDISIPMSDKEDESEDLELKCSNFAFLTINTYIYLEHLKENSAYN
ncbi:UNVERIFIED_CONTAM: hypothetical protein NCL1_55444 [Trichonephila clavipes]